MLAVGRKAARGSQRGRTLQRRHGQRAALTHGSFGLAQISEEALHDERVRALMRRVRSRPAGRGEVELMTVRLADGQRLDQEVMKRPRRLVARADIEEKFLDCAEPVIGAERAAKLVAMIARLEDQSNVEALAAAASGR
jgi:2-methylcitrate dehydratase PrpD